MQEVPEKVRELIRKFEDHKDVYRSPAYNEENLKNDFLNPFFEALGWDVSNDLSLAQAYRDVVQEEFLKIGDWGGEAPDYTFRFGKERKFFVEAKKPSENLQTNKKHVYQLRRYGWSSKLPVSILTDFEEFAIYETTTRPQESASVTNSRILYIQYTEYIERWEEIYNLFSRDAVINGSLEQFAKEKNLRRGKNTVDEEFLKEIERWRSLLAEDLAKQNLQLTINQLNFAVQKIIDRIIFLRVCEDRGFEQYGKLQALQNGNKVYDRLVELFYQADEKYNSGLFHFSSRNDDSESADTFTTSLIVKDDVLKQIFKSLYYPESPFVFEALPQEILGQVYEQFLGKVISLSNHEAKVEEKPEVKKAGGVFYTPTHIVDYIVKETVGKLVEGKTPKQIEKLTIVDPACGSGSFLLGAYTYLLDWHRDWYANNDPKKYTRGSKPAIFQAESNDWRLTLAEKKKILLNNIYGVDIDYQAVEVTKLTLLLKLLEGEIQLHFADTGLLPSLGKNIKCGNSLIGSDFYNQSQGELFDLKERMRINVFDWKNEFKDITDAGGFDVVIGNPPYIRIQEMKEWAPLEVEFYKDEYKSASIGNYDIYVVFVEKGLNLLNSKGLLGFILPHKFFNAQYGQPLRNIIAEGKYLSQIVHFGDQQVFKNATTYTALLFLNKFENQNFEFTKIENIDLWKKENVQINTKISMDSLNNSEWNFTSGANTSLFNKLNDMPSKLNDVADRIFQGLVTGADAVFLLDKIGDGKYFSKATGKQHLLENELLHPLCKGSVDIRRYSVSNLSKSILFPYKLENQKATLLTVDEFQKKFPLAWQYFQANRKLLEEREHGKWKHNKWYAFGRTQNLNEMEQTKIITPSIAKKASFTLDSSDYYYFVGSGGGGGGGYGITLKPNQKIKYEYLLGLLNSHLLDSYLKSYSSPFRGGYFAYNRQYIERLPIKIINFSDPHEKDLHNQIVKLVGSMLILQKELSKTTTEQESTVLKRQIESTDKQIDQLVYELYQLTPEEIKIIEE